MDHYGTPAYRQYFYALKSGSLIKPDQCSLCGKARRIEGHHADYSKPLDVEWLCPDCHYRAHVRIRAKYRWDELVAFMDEKENSGLLTRSWNVALLRVLFRWITGEPVPESKKAQGRSTMNLKSVREILELAQSIVKED